MELQELHSNETVKKMRWFVDDDDAAGKPAGTRLRLPGQTVSDLRLLQSYLPLVRVFSEVRLPDSASASGYRTRVSTVVQECQGAVLECVA